MLVVVWCVLMEWNAMTFLSAKILLRNFQKANQSFRFLQNALPTILLGEFDHWTTNDFGDFGNYRNKSSHKYL
jgi:hypothetical protein